MWIIEWILLREFFLIFFFAPRNIPELVEAHVETNRLICGQVRIPRKIYVDLLNLRFNLEIIHLGVQWRNYYVSIKLVDFFFNFIRRSYVNLHVW